MSAKRQASTSEQPIKNAVLNLSNVSGVSFVGLPVGNKSFGSFLFVILIPIRLIFQIRQVF